MFRRAKERIPSFVSESRLAQGFPERIEDPTVLSKAALLLRSRLDREPEDGHNSAADVGRTAAS